MVYVTHDQVEVMTLADKVVVLNDGLIEQVGAPMELYERPDNLFVAGFIGSPNMNIFDAVVSHGGLALAGGKTVDLPQSYPDGRVRAGVWPEHLVEVADDEAIIRCRLDLVEQLGEYAIVHMNTDDSNAITAKFKRPPSALRGEMIALGFDASNVHLFDAKTGARI